MNLILLFPDDFASDGSVRLTGRRARHILEVQRLIRFMPKVVICVVPGWAVTMARSRSTRQLNRLDLPTLGRPTMARVRP